MFSQLFEVVASETDFKVGDWVKYTKEQAWAQGKIVGLSAKFPNIVYVEWVSKYNLEPHRSKSKKDKTVWDPIDKSEITKLPNGPIIISENMTDKEQFFKERTEGHIKLVQQAAAKIAAQFPEFKDLVNRVKNHDETKFVPPEYEGYVELTWNKFKGIKDVHPLTHSTTLHHIQNNEHHPEYWLKDKSEMTLDPNDRDKNLKVVDATGMPDIAIAEMCADWEAMSEELKTNTAMGWFKEQKDVRWHFSEHQVELITKLLSIFKK